MARKTKPEIEFSPECDAAMARIIDLAHRLSAMLTGDRLSETGQTTTPRSQALAMGMLCFLLRIGPDDLHAVFFAEGSMSQLKFKPMSAGFTWPPLLANML